MFVQSITREKLSTPIVCPDCGQTGVVLWKNPTASRSQSRARQKILLLSSGFVEYFLCKPSGDPQIVCALCDGYVDG